MDLDLYVFGQAGLVVIAIVCIAVILLFIFGRDIAYYIGVFIQSLKHTVLGMNKEFQKGQEDTKEGEEE